MDWFDIRDGDFGGPISWVPPAEEPPPLAQPERPVAKAARMLRARIAGKPALNEESWFLVFMVVVFGVRVMLRSWAGKESPDTSPRYGFPPSLAPHCFGKTARFSGERCGVEREGEGRRMTGST